MLNLSDPIIVLLVAMLLLLYQLFLILSELIVCFIDYCHFVCRFLLSLSKLGTLLLLQCLHVRKVLHQLVIQLLRCLQLQGLSLSHTFFEFKFYSVFVHRLYVSHTHLTSRYRNFLLQAMHIRPRRSFVGLFIGYGLLLERQVGQFNVPQNWLKKSGKKLIPMAKLWTWLAAVVALSGLGVALFFRHLFPSIEDRILLMIEGKIVVYSS